MIDESYIRALKSSTLFYGLNMWPEKFDKTFSPIHLDMDRQLHSCRAPIIIFHTFRKSAKTTFLRTNSAKDSHWSNGSYTVYVASNKQQANKSVQFVADMMMRPNAQALFGNPKANSTKWSIDEYLHFSNKIKFGKWEHIYDSYIEGIGANQPLQGSNIAGGRPTKIILDDIEPPEEEWPEDKVAEALHWFDTVIFYALADHKRSKILVAGTNARAKGFVGQLSKRRNVYVVKYPCMAYTQQLADKFGVPLNASLWEEQYSTEELNEWRYTQPGFMTQMLMLDYDDGSGHRFPMDKIDIFNDISQCPENSTDLKLCFSIDMAYSKTRHADKSAIVAALWDRGHTCYVLQGHQGKMGTPGTMDKLFEMISFWSSIFQGVEIRVGVESKIWDVIQQFFRERRDKFYDEFPGTKISLAELKPGVISKVDRVKAFIPIAEAGRLHVYEPKCKQLLGRIMDFDGKAKRSGDDLEDALAYQRYIGMKNKIPKADAVVTEEARLPWWRKRGLYLIEGRDRAMRRIGGTVF